MFDGLQRGGCEEGACQRVGRCRPARAGAVSLDAKRIRHDLRARVADLKGLLGTHIPQTRQMLRKLMNGSILCAPFFDARGKGYEVTATDSYAGLFRLPTVVNNGGGEGGIRTLGRGLAPTTV